MPSVTLDPLDPEELPLFLDMILALYREDDEGPVTMSPERALRQARQIMEISKTRPEIVCPYMVRSGGGVAGYVILAGFWSNEFGGPMTFVDELYVKPEYRRRGVASATLRRVLETASSNGLTRVSLEVNDGNLRAQRVYKRMGFAEEARATLSVQIRPVENGP